MQIKIINNSKIDTSNLESLIKDQNIEISDEGKQIIYFGDEIDALKSALEEAKSSGVGKFVYVSTTNCYFLRKKITDSLRYHKYVAKFVECEKLVLSYAESMDVSIVELPSIYDNPDEILSVLGVPAINMKRFHLTFEGGNVFMSIENASQAILAVLFNGKRGFIYPLADESLKYKDVLAKRLPEGAKIFEYPRELNFILYLYIKNKLKKEGRESQIDIKKMYSETLAENYFFDDSGVKTALKYEISE